MSISVSNVSFSYKNKPVLHDVSFKLKEHSMLCVLGPNGVGKSTLFNCILGLLPRFTGEILVQGRNVRTYRPYELAREIAYVPQSHFPTFNFSALDMVLMGTTSQIGFTSVPGKQQLFLAREAMERVGISELEERGFMQISGGERQLVLVARALAQKARILVMDEPTANLDYGNQLRVLSQVKGLSREGYTIVQSTHNPDQAFMFADHVLALWEGKVLSYGTPQEMISEGLIKQLYGVDIELQRLYEGKISVCIPRFAIR